MIIQFLLMLLGFACLWKGGDWLVDGATGIANRLHISPFIIGLTLVAFGTSAPELAVNIMASIKGESDITFGNILGSNISNILLILGISGLIMPINVLNQYIRTHVPISIASIMILVALIYTPQRQLSPTLSRIDGVILLVFFVIFLLSVVLPKKNSVTERYTDIGKPLLHNCLLAGTGIILLPLGGKLVTDPTIILAQQFGISTIYVSLITIAIGTSLPELAASVAAALKKQTDIAFANVIGSNIFNILLILGISSTISPLQFNPQLIFEAGFIIAMSLLLIAFAKSQFPSEINRKQSAILLFMYIIYIAFITYRA